MVSHNCCCCCSDKENDPSLSNRAPPFDVINENILDPAPFVPRDYLAPDVPLVEDPDSGIIGGSKVYALTSSKSVEPSLGLGCIDSQTVATTNAGFRHDPDGIPWLPQPWPTWDGITTVDPNTSTKEQIKAFIFPSGPWKMRGLYDLFYSVKPFKNNFSPTAAEIELWHLKVIELYRKLMGINLPIEGSRSLYMRSHWNDERKYTTHWDASYTGTLGSAFGPCVGMSPNNAHCGASFMPTCTDQASYLRTFEPCIVVTGSGAEGIFSGEMDWPWSVKLVRVIHDTLSRDGITAHGGPFINRSLVGMSFKCDYSTQYFTLRIKWAG